MPSVITTVEDTSSDQRLFHWAARVLDDDGLLVRATLSDASVRRYFRLASARNQVIAVAAPTEMNRRFIQRAQELRALDLSVPNICAAESASGFLLLSDLGDDLYLSKLNSSNAEVLYADALMALLTIQSQADVHDLPRYNQRLLNRELLLFTDWFLHKHCGIETDADEFTLCMQAFRVLIENSFEQPQVYVHRDYHSRNLLVLAERSPGILDFQDAVRGPVAYDLVSLLRDCYIAWPEERVDAWREQYRESLRVHTNIHASAEQFKRWFDLCGLQRHLKVLGIFSRLHHQEGKSAYLADMARVLHYVLTVVHRYPEFKAFANYLDRLELIERVSS